MLVITESELRYVTDQTECLIQTCTTDRHTCLYNGVVSIATMTVFAKSSHAFLTNTLRLHIH